MDRLTVFCPDETFIVRVPMELEVILLLQIRWYRERDLEPMRRPARAERLSDVSSLELVRGGVFEGGTSKIWRGVDLELDYLVAGSVGFFDSAAIRLETAKM